MDILEQIKNLKVNIVSENIDAEGIAIWECLVTDENLEVWRTEFSRVKHLTPDEARLMFLNDKEKFYKVN